MQTPQRTIALVVTIVTIILAAQAGQSVKTNIALAIVLFVVALALLVSFILWQYRARPTIVCLCGSTRFYQTFVQANYEETMAGRIVLSVGFYPHAQDEMHGEQVGVTPEQKAALDTLHLRKIDLADEVLFLNVGGYIGESTRRELAYARARGKVIRSLEPLSSVEEEGEREEPQS